MSETVRLDLPVLLPDVRTARDRCIERLLAEMEARDGVERAHVVDDGRHPAQLCLHYDPGRLPLERVRELCATAGARLTGHYGHVDVADGGIRHARRARTIEQVLARMPGVVDASATVAGPVHVEFDHLQTDARRIEAALASLGVAEQTGRPEAHGHDHEHRHEAGHHHGESGPRAELWGAAGAGAALAAGFLVEKLLPGVPASVSLACYLIAYLAGGWFTARDAVAALRRGRFEIDTLMLVAAIGAAALGQWPEGALLLFLFGLGHALEHAAMGRASAEIRALARLAPERALRIEDGATTDVPVDSLRIGDELLVRPGDRLAADGFVVAGASVVDQSAVTGESAGIEKSAVPDIVAAAARPGDIPSAHLLFAGSLNGPSTLEMMVTRTSDDSLLARAARMAAGAEAYKGRSQRFAERFERWFVPAVLLLVVMLLFAFLVVDEPFSASFYRAMAVLVAASPCALAISTPSAILSGIARAARAGLLVKGGSALEALGEVKTIAFDKTGTLTPGRPQLTDLVAAEGVDEAALLAAAAAAEQQLGHPLARAITAAAHTRLGAAFPPPAATIENLPGLGVAAAMDGAPLLIGSDALLEAHGGAPAPALAARAAALRDAGRTVVFVRHAGRDLGLLALMDEARPEAPAVLAALRTLGIGRFVMLSGDSPAVAGAIASALGLSDARGGLLPDDKVRAIVALRTDAPVAMVGDGINDGPALASANVGIAMGAAGSDVALEAADVALMGERLDALPFAIQLGRATRRTIRQNLAISLGMVAVLVPLTIFGLRIGPAVAAHEGSTLLVVLNGLRLLRLRAAD